jgi:glutamyl-tRNA(Gln) amidotransferase subunit E
MYPDTDLPPKKITQERLEKIKTWLPEQFWKRIEWYNKLRIPKDTIEELSISKYAELFKKAVNEWKVNPTTAAVFLIQYPKRLKKYGIMNEWINEDLFENIIKSYADRKIPKDALLSTLKTVTELGAFTEEVILKPIVNDELNKEIKIATEQLQKIKLYNPDNKEKVLMGMIMKKHRGRIPATIVAEKIGLMKEKM